MTGLVLLVLRILLATALYTFLGWALYTIWNDLQSQGYAVTGRKIPTLSLLTQSNLPSQEFHFTQLEITVGRGHSNNCPLENETVSSRQALIVYRQSQWWIEDQNSTNGTYLNGQRLSTTTVLTSGDLLGFGEVILLVTIAQNN